MMSVAYVAFLLRHSSTGEYHPIVYFNDEEPIEDVPGAAAWPMDSWEAIGVCTKGMNKEEAEGEARWALWDALDQLPGRAYYSFITPEWSGDVDYPPEDILQPLLFCSELNQAN